MKKTSSKPNISPLEVEIEQKKSLAYLLSIAAKTPGLRFGDIYQILHSCKSTKNQTDRKIDN